jgi:hypothetical protein
LSFLPTPQTSNKGNKLQISKCLLRVLLCNKEKRNAGYCH